MTLIDFDNQLQQRIVTIRKMAKVDIMGARREVDQLRREFVTVLTEPMCIETVLQVTQIANELDELDKFDMPEEKTKGLEKGTVIETLRWLRDETVGEGYTVTENEYLYNQFDLIIDQLNKPEN